MPTKTFEVRHRPDHCGRWRRVGTAETFAEAVALINSRGDWHIRPTPGLTAEAEADDFEGAT